MKSSTAGQDRVTEPVFTLFLLLRTRGRGRAENIQETPVFKTLGIRQWRMWSVRWRKQVKWAEDCPNLLSSEFPQHREEEQAESGRLPGLRKQSWEFSETEATRVHRTEHPRGEGCTDTELPRPADQRPPAASSRALITHTWGKPTRLGRAHKKGLEGKVGGAHTKPVTVSVSSSQTEKLRIHGALGRVLRKLWSEL